MSTVADPGTGEQAAAARANADAPACPNCGAPADRGQLMCLDCGSRLALDYRRPPAWRVPAAIFGCVLLLAGIGVAIAIAAVAGESDQANVAAPAQTAPAPPPPQNTPGDTAPTGSQTTPTPTASTPTPAPSGGAAPTASTPTPAPATPAPTSADGWPPGESGFTVIVASLQTKAEAQAKLDKAKAAGIAGAALLHSDDFPTLRAGYWVVFDGRFDSVSQANAQAAADAGKPGFADAYSRFVSKDPNAKP